MIRSKLTLLGRRSPSGLISHHILCISTARRRGDGAVLLHATRYQYANIPSDGNHAPVASSQLQRSIHVTSILSNGDPPPLSRRANFNDTHGKRSGFESFFNRHNHIHNKKNSAAESHFQEASTLPCPREYSEEEWLDDDYNGMISSLGDKKEVRSEYYFSKKQFKSQWRDWHKKKEVEFQQLSAETERVLESPLENESHFQEALSLMKDWNAFLSIVTSELYSLSVFRRKNQQYPASDFMTSITSNTAEKVESLLVHLIRGVVYLPPEIEVNAYELTMSAWSQVFHPLSGDRCETILEQYGERFGGDMNYMPTVDAYKTVLEAHLKSCSSYSAASEGAVPGEKALGILNLLTNVYTAGDLFLKPDLELYSHTIAVVRNTLQDWQSRRRFRCGENRPLENDLALRLLDALRQMESLLKEESTSVKKYGENQLSLHQWYYAIRAYADGLAITARIPISNYGNETENLLMKLEHFITANSSKILFSIGEAGLTDTDVKYLLEEIQKTVEESYTNAISSGLVLSKENGSFADFNSTIKNALASEKIFQRMRHRSQGAPSDLNFLFPLPTPDNYQALIECWCECVHKRYSSPESNIAMANLEDFPHLKAECLLNQLEIQQAAQPIDGSIYLAVIWAWSQVLNWQVIYEHNEYFFDANAVEELLKKTMHGYRNGSVYFSWKGTVTKMYNIFFRLNSKISKDGEGAIKRSLNLLAQMEYWYRQSEGAIAQPDTFTFGLILQTISNSGVQSSASIAETMLQRMEDFGIEPREKHYLGVIRAYSRVGEMGVSDPMKAEAILHRVKELYNKNNSVKPITAIYSACISAYGGSKQHNSASKVMELFEELKGLHNETGEKAFQPDSMLYSAVIDAISKAKSNHDASLRQALKLLDRMEKKYDLGVIEAGPNRYAYTNLLHSISRSKIEDRASLAEDMMKRMHKRSRQLNDESIRPDVHTYTILIQLLSQSGLCDAVERAQRWFKQMKDDSGLKPNKVTFTALISCWRYSGREKAGEEAENLLSLMEIKCEEGNLELKPDVFVYASVIDAWARCKSHDKALRAWNVYQRMKQKYLNGNMETRPNNIIMTSIIKACGYTRGSIEDKKKALKVLLECMADLNSEKYISSNSITYRSLLNAVRALVADDAKRRPISATIFETCCRKGQVDATVLDALERVQPDLYVKLPGDIPSKWKEHANYCKN